MTSPNGKNVSSQSDAKDVSDQFDVACPTCRRVHAVTIKPGTERIIKCACGKGLEAARSQYGGNPVVRELIQGTLLGDDAPHT